MPCSHCGWSRWKATACAVTETNRFGAGSATTRTRQPLIARLQAPRFFVVGDTVTVSGVLNNNTDRPMTVEPELEVKGLTITAIIKDGKVMKRGVGRVRWGRSVGGGP